MTDESKSREAAGRGGEQEKLKKTLEKNSYPGMPGGSLVVDLNYAIDAIEEFMEAPAATAVPGAGSAAQLAQKFHETYERLAPNFGYKTREASAKPWAEVPEQNKRLMIAVCAEVLGASSEGASPKEQVNEG